MNNAFNIVLYARVCIDMWNKQNRGISFKISVFCFMSRPQPDNVENSLVSIVFFYVYVGCNTCQLSHIHILATDNEWLDGPYSTQPLPHRYGKRLC